MVNMIYYGMIFTIMVNNIVGKRISVLRKQKGISQEELAFIAHVDRTYISRIESAGANPSLRLLAKIANKLDISVAELLRDVK